VDGNQEQREEQREEQIEEQIEEPYIKSGQARSRTVQRCWGHTAADGRWRGRSWLP
jgi:hypothetical protein